MTKIDIFSGFLGAGKTTLIKKLLADGYEGEKIVLIENEFGEIGIDSGFLAEAGVAITEMNQGCICCTLVGDFTQAMKKVIDEFAPDRIIIEPSGVGKLSDVAEAVEGVEDTEIAAMVTVVDARKCRIYRKNFGEFFNNQIESAGTIVLSHADEVTEERMAEALHIVKELNDDANLISTGWDQLSGAQIMHEFKAGEGHEHEEHHHDHDHEHEHHHEHEHEHHHDHEHEHEHEHHHHHDHDDECECGHHHHHHDHDHECGCGHDHDHHHADEVFTSCGVETVHKFDEAELEAILDSYEGNENILRAKGMVEGKDGKWIFFDFVPGTKDIREGSPQTIGKACVIGTVVDEDEVRERFSAC